jgi:hypothetical protein
LPQLVLVAHAQIRLITIEKVSCCKKAVGFRGLAQAPGFGMNAGIEYQANPNWMLRAETHLGISGGGSRRGADFMPGLSFGFYRSLGN